jgi:hypothetical protein
MRAPLLVLLVLAACRPVDAQPAWVDMPVPPASLAGLDIGVDHGRGLALLRAIRVLHTSPQKPETMPAPMARFYQVLIDLDRVEAQTARLGARPISLAMAKTNTERDGLKDLFDVIGVRLRERKKQYSAELEKDKDATELRKRLASVGLDVDAAVKRLNGGESVMLAPTVIPLPSPLPLDVWARVVFERPLPARAVFGAIVRDRQAALLFHGLASMTAPTRAFIAARPELLRHLYRDLPGAVAAFGGAFRVDAAGRVVVPGGADAAELWEALADERLDQPEKFARRVFERDNGRLAYFLDAVDRLDRPHQAFVLGLWVADRGLRADRVKALYRVFADVEPQWSVADRPFSKPLYDPGSLMAAVHVSTQGAPAGPTFRKFWSEAFDGIDLPAPDARLKDVGEDGLVDAAWLAEHIAMPVAAERRALRERLLFGQRVFGATPVSELPLVLVALRGYGRFPALMTTLERIGLTRPQIYADAARHALAIEAVESPRRAVPLLSQFQAAVALIARGARSGAFDAAAADALVTALVAVRVANDGYQGAVLRWVDRELRSRLVGADGDPVELRLLRTIADRAEPASPFEWEGATYVPDVGGSALASLQAVRAKQGGNSLDALLAAWHEVAALQVPSLTLADIKTHANALRAAGARLVAPRPWPDLPEDLPEAKKVLDKAVKELSGITKPKDTGKAAREVEDVVELLDLLLGETLTALAYAPSVGDPSALLGPEADVSHRHDFGLTAKAGAPTVSRRSAWQRPNWDSADNVGQGLKGAVLGVDLPLAKKLLRRLSTDRVPSPKLNPNDAIVFTETLALTNPADLTTADLSRVGEAVVRGRARLVAAGTDLAALDALAEAAAMGDARREALPWVAREVPAQIGELFSTNELFWLGGALGGVDQALVPWGTSSEPVEGCACKAFPAPGAWDWLSGRPGSTQLATAVPDLNLRLAEHLAALKVPASLFPSVLAMATQDFIDGAPPVYDDDWLGIVAFAGQVTRERVEDYVAALVASGPVRDASAEGAAK